MSEQQANHTTLDAAHQAVLDTVLDCIIPPAPERGLPGAADVGVWAFMCRLAPALRASTLAELDWVDVRARQRYGRGLAELERGLAAELLAALRRERESLLSGLASYASGCYYQHDTVLKVIGAQARAPFPDGYDVAPGDLSLLDPVKARGPIFREV